MNRSMSKFIIEKTILVVYKTGRFLYRSVLMDNFLIKSDLLLSILRWEWLKSFPFIVCRQDNVKQCGYDLAYFFS